MSRSQGHMHAGPIASAGDRSLPQVAAVKADVLVVDDLPEKLLVYRTVLEELGVNLVLARSGQEALKAVLQQEFAVILLDVNMPGMDGFETATLIRQRRRSSTTPIIFITAFTDEMRMEQGYASGAVDYIPTPVVPGILRAKVQVFVELFQMRRATAMQAEERARRQVAEEAAQRSDFLAAAGDALTRSLTTGPLPRTVAGLAVPFLADVCVFVQAAEGTLPQRVHCAWGDGTPGGPQRAEECPNAFLMGALERALHTDEYRLIAPLPKDPARPDHLPDLAGGSAIVLPLIFHARNIGAIAFVRTAADHTYPPDDVSVAQDLAARISIALENARLVRDIQEADQRKDEFLGMLAHELRNPLAPMRTALDLLDMHEPADPLVSQARNVIDRQVTHMTRLVDDLLDATRIARGKVLLRQERCDMAAIVRNTVVDHERLFEDRGITLTMHFPDVPAWTIGDPTRLAQVVGNLLHNAHKFTDAGGTVGVRLRVEEDHGHGILTVHDSGVGIPPEVLPHVFDVFRQAEQGLDRSRGGLGLGLSLVKGLVELHGGTVSARSDGLGRGTAITVDLPLARSGEEDVPDGLPFTASAGPYRVLLIHPDAGEVGTLRGLLHQEKHEVLLARTGKEALEAVLRHQPQVVMMAVRSTDIDTDAFVLALRSVPGSPPSTLIALHGQGDPVEGALARAGPFDLRLGLPADLPSLRRALARILALRSTTVPFPRAT